MREDRTPGGKHRHKRLKVDGEEQPVLENITLLESEQLESDEKDMLHKLIEAKPTIHPSPDGKCFLNAY